MIEGRSVTEYVSDVDFPARKGHLVAAARARGAPPEVVDRLEAIPTEWVLSPLDLPELPPSDALETPLGPPHR